jgi:hypothetical protein
MEKTIQPEIFTKNLYPLLEEAFETHYGIFLDKDTSLFDTLETISAEQASIPVGGKCATLAAQVSHVIFYLEVMEKYMQKQLTGRVDWGEIWRTVQGVTPDEWEALKARLKETYRRVYGMIKAVDNWDDEDTLGGAMAIVVHTAYHLGEIRQALCTLQ